MSEPAAEANVRLHGPREDLIAREARDIAEALTSIEAGRTVSLEQLEAWLDSLETANPLPRPSTGL